MTHADLTTPILSPPTAGVFEDALRLCQAKGMRISRQRRYILELLWQSGEHLSAREIYDRLNHLGKPIGHTSVYQNLEALATNGVIECIDRSEGRLYGHCTLPHSHLYYTDPQGHLHIVDIHIHLPSHLLAQIEQQTHTQLTGYRLEFYGHQA